MTTVSAACLAAAPVVVSLALSAADAGDAGSRQDSGLREVQCASKQDCFEKAKACEKGIPKDYETAALFYEQACDKGASTACLRLAELLSVGIVLARDEKRALTLRERACTHGDPQGCDEAASMYHAGSRERGAIPRDYAKAAWFFEKGCAGGAGASCHMLAYMYRSGKGVRRDRGRATALQKRAKDLGFEIPD
jgi:TPR repeat protein